MGRMSIQASRVLHTFIREVLLPNFGKVEACSGVNLLLDTLVPPALQEDPS